jgi:hypothetical protein
MLAGSLDGPADRRWVDAGASGCATVVGESNMGRQASVKRSVAHEIRVDAVEHEFRTAEHVEGTAIIDVPPRQIDEAFTAFALHGRSSEVERSITVDNDADIEFPAGIGCIAPHQVFGFRADLNTDVDVDEHGAVGLTKCPSWQIGADHDDSHNRESYCSRPA